LFFSSVRSTNLNGEKKTKIKRQKKKLILKKKKLIIKKNGGKKRLKNDNNPAFFATFRFFDRFPENWRKAAREEVRNDAQNRKKLI
jgi:hypothetical protein